MLKQQSARMTSSCWVEVIRLYSHPAGLPHTILFYRALTVREQPLFCLFYTPEMSIVTPVNKKKKVKLHEVISMFSGAERLRRESLT